MEVVLLNHTPELLRTIYAAARSCYAPGTPSLQWEKAPAADKMVALIEKTIGSGHLSVAEHVTFVFAVNGISRACSHQLVRHRIASFSQQSQRYVTFQGEIDYVFPPSIAAHPKAQAAFADLVNAASQVYQSLVELGIAAEDARYVLPNACPTNLVMTMNFRELIHASSLRLCQRAQWEIRELFEEIARLVNDVNPYLGKYLQPKCESLGFCDEAESLACGKKPTRKQLGI